MEGIFSTHAPILSQLIMVGEFYCGVAILLGLFTRPALLAGMFMSLNFLLAGSVNPSAFYMVIQLALLASAAGQVFGLDAYFMQVNPFAELLPHRRWSIEGLKALLYFGGSLISGLLAILAASYITTIDPTHCIEDPAVLLLILLSLQALLLLILGIRATSHSPDVRAHPAKAPRNKVIQPIRQNPIPEYVAPKPYSAWTQMVGFEQSS